MLRQHREIAERRERRRAAAGDDRDRDAVRFEECDRARQELAGRGALDWIRHQSFEADARHVHGEATKLARRFRCLHAVPPEAGIAFDQDRHVVAVTDAGLRQAAHHRLVVGDHRKPLHAR